MQQKPTHALLKQKRFLEGAKIIKMLSTFSSLLFILSDYSSSKWISLTKMVFFLVF